MTEAASSGKSAAIEGLAQLEQLVDDLAAFVDGWGKALGLGEALGFEKRLDLLQVHDDHSGMPKSLDAGATDERVAEGGAADEDRERQADDLGFDPKLGQLLGLPAHGRQGAALGALAPLDPLSDG